MKIYSRSVVKAFVALPITVLVYASVVQAQSSSAVPPEFNNVSTTGNTDADNAGGSSRFSLSNISAAMSSGLPLIKRGPVALRPHFQYRYLYGDRVLAGPGILRKTSIQSISPGVLTEIGNHWRVDYTPTWTIYSDKRAFRDTFDQSANVSTRYGYGPWTFQGSHGYDSRNIILVETARQTHLEKHGTVLEANYKVGERTRIETSFTRSVRYANAIGDAPEWTTSDWLQYSSTDWIRYQITSRVSLAGGATFGFAEVSVGDDMSFVQPQGQIEWLVTNKISLSLQSGVEIRRFRDGARRPLKSPTYLMSISYQPLETTKFHVDASRNVSASYFANEITRSNGWSAGFEQRLLKRFYLNTNVSTRRTDFIGVRSATTARRADEYRALHARLSTALFRRTAVSLFYQTGENDSGLAEYEFSTEQMGFEFRHRF